MSLRAEYWYRRGTTVRAARNSRAINNAADVDEILELVRISWITDLAVSSDGSSGQLVIGSFDNELGAAFFSGPEGWYFTKGDGPDHETSFFQTDFPPNIRVPLKSIRAVLMEFLSTGTRSEKVEWKKKPIEPVSEDEKAELDEIFAAWGTTRKSA